MSKRQRDDAQRFRVRPGPPKARQQRFISRVLTEVSKAGGPHSRSAAGRPGARLGRGHVAARFAGANASSGMRRVAFKVRIVKLKQAGARSTETHLRYLERDSVGPDGEKGQAYGAVTDEADLTAFKERSQGNRHQFRFIVSPEDAEQLGDLHRYTRTLMGRMEGDLGTRLDWVAVDHWDTDNPHTHIVLRGKDELGRDLVIAGDYIAHGMRHRAAELATEWLGIRSEQEIQQTLHREVNQERWTSLDRALQRQVVEGQVRVTDLAATSSQQRQLLVGRLQTLTRLGLAEELSPGAWRLHPNSQTTLTAMAERGDIIRTMQRAMGSQPRELAIHDPTATTGPITGRVIGKGLMDELNERGYLIVDGIDGKAHYVALSPNTDLTQYGAGAVVEVRHNAKPRAVDRTIAHVAQDGIYRTEHHLAVAQRQALPGRDPHEVVQVHVRRLEALRRAGLVERISDGVWRVSADLPSKAHEYDLRRHGATSVVLRSPLSIEQQVRAIGATWLDEQLTQRVTGMSDRGFGADVRDALHRRVDHLAADGLAQRRGQQIVLARNLLATLRERDITAASQSIAAATGMVHRPVVDGERVTGVYRRDLQLASGRFAMLDDGRQFTLVPWRPVIEARLGQSVAAIVRGEHVSWGLGRQPGRSVG